MRGGGIFFSIRIYLTLLPAYFLPRVVSRPRPKLVNLYPPFQLLHQQHPDFLGSSSSSSPEKTRWPNFFLPPPVLVHWVGVWGAF